MNTGSEALSPKARVCKRLRRELYDLEKDLPGKARI